MDKEKVIKEIQSLFYVDFVRESYVYAKDLYGVMHKHLSIFVRFKGSGRDVAQMLCMIHDGGGNIIRVDYDYKGLYVEVS